MHRATLKVESKKKRGVDSKELSNIIIKPNLT